MRIGAQLYHNRYDAAVAEQELVTNLQPSTSLAMNLVRTAFAKTL
jgi:hypothetical protein